VQILIALCNSEALVHPWNGRRAMQGTNPFAIGIPLAGEPFVLDMATSLVSMGEIHHHANLNRPTPSGGCNGLRAPHIHIGETGSFYKPLINLLGVIGNSRTRTPMAS
jgi:hypothetical protein